MVRRAISVLRCRRDARTQADRRRATGGLLATLGVTLVKVVAFVALMLVVGRRVIPWLLGRVVGTGSRELFTLATLAIALGIALGAFFAGVVVSESDFSHEAATSALPLQDAFAVPCFVSVGMLFDPTILVRQPVQVLAVVAIILVGKSAASLGLVLAFRYPVRTALLISASLAQIGEFSFILAALGVSLGHLPREAQSLVVAAPDAYQGRAVLAMARRLRPDVELLLHTHGDAERAFLEAHGAAQALVAERELAVSLTRAVRQRYAGERGGAPDMRAVAARVLAALGSLRAPARSPRGARRRPDRRPPRPRAAACRCGPPAARPPRGRRAPPRRGASAAPGSRPGRRRRRCSR